MTDRYTKIVLTVIASTLAILVVQNATRPAIAQGGECGSRRNPCHVEVSNTVTVDGKVEVTNSFIPSGGRLVRVPLSVSIQ
jgi:hypothetical protein